MKWKKRLFLCYNLHNQCTIQCDQCCPSPTITFHLIWREGGGRREEGDLMMKQWGGQLKSVSSVETKLTVIYLLFGRHTPTLYQDSTHSSLTQSPFSIFWLSHLIITFYIDSVSPKLSCFILRLFSCLRLKLRACQEVGNLQLTMQFLTIQTLWRLWTVMVSTILICDDRVNVWCWKDANAQNLFH